MLFFNHCQNPVQRYALAEPLLKCFEKESGRQTVFFGLDNDAQNDPEIFDAVFFAVVDFQPTVEGVDRHAGGFNIIRKQCDGFLGRHVDITVVLQQL